MKAEIVRMLLTDKGIPTISHREGDDCYDAEVRINQSIHVQIGERYLLLWRERKNGTFSYCHVSSVNDLIKRLRRMLKINAN